eukprot:COSAG01_NODE_20791_length_935_cov_0.913876_1_plen_147_part_00
MGRRGVCVWGGGGGGVPQRRQRFARGGPSCRKLMRLPKYMYTYVNTHKQIVHMFPCTGLISSLQHHNHSQHREQSLCDTCFFTWCESSSCRAPEEGGCRQWMVRHRCAQHRAHHSPPRLPYTIKYITTTMRTDLSTNAHEGPRSAT